MTKERQLANPLEVDIPSTHETNPDLLADSIRLAKLAARAAAENKGQDIVLLDVSRHSSIFDCFLIVTGTSRRQLHAMADEINHVMKEAGEKRMSTSGYDESRWIVLDYGGVLVHLFDEETRQFYDIEGLWADSPQIDLTEALKNTGATVIRSHD